jgi:ATP-binding cassette, subfamily B (MDR/TAP), member 1
MIGILFAAIMSGVYLGQLPNIQNARVSTHRVRRVIQACQTPEQRTAGDNAFAITQGQIEFRNVDFAYPTRPDNQIFSNFNLTIRAGEKVAIVGASGSGKSTITALIQRFYSLAGGEVSNELRLF